MLTVDNEVDTLSKPSGESHARSEAEARFGLHLTSNNCGLPLSSPASPMGARSDRWHQVSGWTSCSVSRATRSIMQVRSSWSNSYELTASISSAP